MLETSPRCSHTSCWTMRCSRQRVRRSSVRPWAFPGGRRMMYVTWSTMRCSIRLGAALGFDDWLADER